MKRIYLFANFGDWKKQPYGGGEVGNRRTLQLLRKCGYEIKLIEKYQRVKDHSFFNKCLLLVRMVLNICKFLSVLIFGRRTKSIVHIVGFYGPMVYFERTLVSIAKRMGYKVVYEMRGGGADDYYDNGSKLYRKFFDAIIHESDCIFSQGLENYSLIDRIDVKKDRFYYPNFVMHDFAPVSYPVKPVDCINMLYFGRISKTKNVGIVLQTMKILHEKYPDMTLSIVGNHTDDTYYNSLMDYVQTNGLSGCIRFFPACIHEELKEHLKDKHFYIFPTTEPHEGHSNAMTEAMAWGLIPVATSQGFNRSVVDNQELIVSELTPEAFADRVTKVIDSGLVEAYSKQSYDRVKSYYCAESVFDKLNAKYNKLFESV